METSNNLNHIENAYVIYGIDKITLGIEAGYLNFTKTPEQLKGILDITQWGNWLELNIQCEYNGVSQINPHFPLFSVLCAINYANSNGLFIEPLANDLYNCIKGIFSGHLSPYSFINKYFETDIFKFDEYELFFDFYNYSPFLGFDESTYTFFDNSVYTPDFRRYRNKQGETTAVKRSMLIYYDRGIKLNTNAFIKRMELRICDKRAKLILTPFDLLNSVDSFIDFHGMQIKSILKRYIPPNSINYDEEYIIQNAPKLINLLWFLKK